MKRLLAKLMNFTLDERKVDVRVVYKDNSYMEYTMTLFEAENLMKKLKKATAIPRFKTNKLYLRLNDVRSAMILDHVEVPEQKEPTTAIPSNTPDEWIAWIKKQEELDVEEDLKDSEVDY